MKDFFTLFIAVVLFSLCLLEKEARKNALLNESENKAVVQSGDITNEKPDNQNLMTNSGSRDNNKILVADYGSGVNRYGRFVSTDSLIFSLSEEKQEAKIY